MFLYCSNVLRDMTARIHTYVHTYVAGITPREVQDSGITLIVQDGGICLATSSHNTKGRTA